MGDYNLYVLDETIKKTNNLGEREFWVKARAKNNKNPIAHMDVLGNIDCNKKQTKFSYVACI